MSDVLQGEVVALSSEGHGILRHQNLVIFVPFTAPGDMISYRILHHKKNFAFGELLEVLESSSHRAIPLCRYYGHCGGCQLQHLNYQMQLNTKSLAIEAALKRIGKMDHPCVQPVIGAELNWNYRKHITLKIKPYETYLIAGYVTIDNQTLLPVKHCPIFIPDHDPVIQEVQGLLKNFSSQEFSEGSAVLFKAFNEQFILQLRLENPLKLNSKTFENFLKNHPRWLGVILRDGKNRRTWGRTEAFIEMNGMQFICSPEVFTQNHPEQSAKIYQTILSLVGSPPAKKILDLYCGIGISSLLLAKESHSVIGVEYNPLSIKFAQQNSQMNALNNVTFLQGDVEKILQGKLKHSSADTIIVNPPRIGLTPLVIQEILRRKPQHILYISCMPSTLARDLKTFMPQYEVILVQPIDMFPQTMHVETIVHLQRKIY